MTEEQRPAKFHPKGKGNPVVLLAIIIIGGVLIRVLVDFGTDGEGRRRRGKDVGDQGFVVASYGVVHLEAEVLGPVPVEGVGPLRIPVPLYAKPKLVAAFGKGEIVFFQPVAGGNEALHHEGRFHKVSAVVVLAEGEGFHGICVVPVSPGAVEALQLFKGGDYLLYALNAFLAGVIPSFGTGNYGHEAETGTADGHYVAVGVVVTLPGKAGCGIREIREIAYGGLFNYIQKGVVRELLWGAGHARYDGGDEFKFHT